MPSHCWNAAYSSESYSWGCCCSPFMPPIGHRYLTTQQQGPGRQGAAKSARQVAPDTWGRTAASNAPAHPYQADKGLCRGAIDKVSPQLFHAAVLQ
jgi:hypothetical protein